MTLRSRHVAIAAVAGLLASAAAIFGGVWLADALDDTPPIDGEFVLDEPGIFSEPTDGLNPDTSGIALPRVELADVQGAPVVLTEYLGAPLVVNFWFSRCAPCRRELSDFATVHAELGDRVQFVGVDPFDTVEAMQRFAAERGVAYDLLLDDGSLSDDLGIVGYPVTLFVSAEGLVLRQTGEIDADTLRATIEELF